VKVPSSRSCGETPRSAATASKLAPVLDPRRGGLGLRLGREGDLLHRAALRRAVLGLLLLVALAGIRVRNGVGLGQGGRVEGHDGEGPVLGSPEGALALLEEALELLVGGSRNLPRHGGGEDEIAGGAPLVGVAVQGLPGRDRNVHVAGHRLGQVKARHGGALLLDEAGLRQGDVAQGLVEEGAVELAVRSLEGRVLHDGARDGLVGDAQPELPRLLGHHRLGDEVGDDPLVEAGGPGLLGEMTVRN
jgi:hypothetical protein